MRWLGRCCLEFRDGRRPPIDVDQAELVHMAGVPGSFFIVGRRGDVETHWPLETIFSITTEVRRTLK